jgi:hypothetical protein
MEGHKGTHMMFLKASRIEPKFWHFSQMRRKNGVFLEIHFFA